jgi:GNAT superfamily N-acetyltransferase
MPLDPNLRVSLLTPEEAETYVHIRHETFRPTVNKILYSRGEPSPSTLARVASETRSNITKGVIFLKCVDTSNGEIVAAARWRYVRPKDTNATERTWEEVEKDFTEVLQPYDESEPAMIDALFALFNGRKRKYLGTRPYYCLDTLATLGKHERRGAGSLLVQWGCERADEEGVEAYLEASEMGEPMYKRHGFESKDVMELDLRKYGGEEVLRFIVSINGGGGEMRTDECVADGETEEERSCGLKEWMDCLVVGKCLAHSYDLRKSMGTNAGHGEDRTSLCGAIKSWHTSCELIHVTGDMKSFDNTQTDRICSLDLVSISLFTLLQCKSLNAPML